MQTKERHFGRFNERKSRIPATFPLNQLNGINECADSKCVSNSKSPHLCSRIMTCIQNEKNLG